MNAVDLLFGATAATYLAASVLFIRFLMGTGRPEDEASRMKLAPRLVAIGVVLHASHIVVSSLVLNVCPIKGMHFAMSVVSMFGCAAYLVARLRYRIDVVGAFVAPFALTFLIGSQMVGLTSGTTTFGAILPVHVVANLLGDAFFLLASGAAVLYLVLDQRVKQKQMTGLTKRLPPLDALDQAEHRFLLAGFPLLTIGILTGTVFARKVEFGGGVDRARAAFGYLTWLVFALVLLLRAAAGWRGRKAAWGTIAGFGVAVLVLVLYLIKSLSVEPVRAVVGLLP